MIDSYDGETVNGYGRIGVEIFRADPGCKWNWYVALDHESCAHGVEAEYSAAAAAVAVAVAGLEADCARAREGA